MLTDWLDNYKILTSTTQEIGYEQLVKCYSEQLKEV